MIHSRF